jgi:naphtho-gamma-pyrone polyketide synthase
MIWTTDSVCNSSDSPRPAYRDDDPKELRWLLNHRMLGEIGLMGGEESLVVEKIEATDRYSIMQGRIAGAVSRFVGRAYA